jgi:dolichyl-phosphate beta-glucosyltransferase
MISPRWSVVIPALNEARRLPPYLARVVSYFDARSEPYEIIVVDDGSTDDTLARVESFAREHGAVRGLALAGHEGKGAAVRRGMLAAAGTYRLFTDADGATPIEELDRFEPALAAGADIVIGSRTVGDASVAVVSRLHRSAARSLFSWMVSRLGLKGVSDSQCGFKAFEGAVAEALFGALRTPGLAFDVELLMRARTAGYHIVEVPVNWTEQAGGRVGILRHGPLMALEILRVRRRLKGLS